MRISITGEKGLIQEIEAALEADSAVKTELPRHINDRTELEFGIAEMATIVAIISGIAQFIEHLAAIASHLKKGETQKLQLKTAVGTVTLDIHPDVSAVELQQLLKTLEPQP